MDLLNKMDRMECVINLNIMNVIVVMLIILIVYLIKCIFYEIEVRQNIIKKIKNETLKELLAKIKEKNDKVNNGPQMRRKTSYSSEEDMAAMVAELAAKEKKKKVA